MICPICQNTKNTVTQSVQRGGAIYRKRKCCDPACAAVIYTVELEVRGKAEAKVRRVLQHSDAQYRAKRKLNSGQPEEQR